MLPVAFLYGDYACPHSYLAYSRLSLLASETGLTITWRPLPTYGPVAERDWRWLSEDPLQLQSCIEELGRAAAQLGLSFRLPDRPPATRRALQGGEFARDCGPAEFHRFHRAVFRAVFSEGVDVGDPQVLAQVADGAGIDSAALEVALEDGRYDKVLDEVEAEAVRYGITATPTVLIGRFKVVGAAPLDILRSTLNRAAQANRP